MEGDNSWTSVHTAVEHVAHEKEADKEVHGAKSIASMHAQTLTGFAPLPEIEPIPGTEVDKGPKVSFMTTLDRELFPTKMPPNRFGNETCPLRGAPHRGPGCYENEDKTSFWYNIENKLHSTKGYTLGARTACRLPKQLVMNTPAPSAYQQKYISPKEFETCKKPFEVGCDRFPVYRRDINDVLPGPGAFEHNIQRDRKVQWHQAFGGTPILMPTIQVRSIIDRNTEKLYSTKEEKKYNKKLAYLKLYYE